MAKTQHVAEIGCLSRSEPVHCDLRSQSPTGENSVARVIESDSNSSLSGNLVNVAGKRDMSEVVVKKYVVRFEPEERARLEALIGKGKHSAA